MASVINTANAKNIVKNLSKIYNVEHQGNNLERQDFLRSEDQKAAWYGSSDAYNDNDASKMMIPRDMVYKQTIRGDSNEASRLVFKVMGQITANVYEKNGQLIIAFKGTSTLGDFITDVNAFKSTSANTIIPNAKGNVHSGFLAAYGSIRKELKQIIDANPDKKVLFTGHSLGGALATLAGAEFTNNARVITYGAPQVGDDAFVDAYTTQTDRVVHSSDPVTFMNVKYNHTTQTVWDLSDNKSSFIDISQHGRDNYAHNSLNAIDNTEDRETKVYENGLSEVIRIAQDSNSLLQKVKKGDKIYQSIVKVQSMLEVAGQDGVATEIISAIKAPNGLQNLAADAKLAVKLSRSRGQLGFPNVKVATRIFSRTVLKRAQAAASRKAVTGSVEAITEETALLAPEVAAEATTEATAEAATEVLGEAASEVLAEVALETTAISASNVAAPVIAAAIVVKEGVDMVNLAVTDPEKAKRKIAALDVLTDPISFFQVITSKRHKSAPVTHRGGVTFNKFQEAQFKKLSTRVQRKVIDGILHRQKNHAELLLENVYQMARDRGFTQSKDEFKKIAWYDFKGTISIQGKTLDEWHLQESGNFSRDRDGIIKIFEKNDPDRIEAFTEEKFTTHANKMRSIAMKLSVEPEIKKEAAHQMDIFQAIKKHKLETEGAEAATNYVKEYTDNFNNSNERYKKNAQLAEKLERGKKHSNEFIEDESAHDDEGPGLAQSVLDARAKLIKDENKRKDKEAEEMKKIEEEENPTTTVDEEHPNIGEMTSHTVEDGQVTHENEDGELVEFKTEPAPTSQSMLHGNWVGVVPFATSDPVDHLDYLFMMWHGERKGGNNEIIANKNLLNRLQASVRKSLFTTQIEESLATTIIESLIKFGNVYHMYAQKDNIAIESINLSLEQINEPIGRSDVIDTVDVVEQAMDISATTNDASTFSFFNAYKQRSARIIKLAQNYTDDGGDGSTFRLERRSIEANDNFANFLKKLLDTKFE